jgi:hypothetical protein
MGSNGTPYFLSAPSGFPRDALAGGVLSVRLPAVRTVAGHRVPWTVRGTTCGSTSVTINTGGLSEPVGQVGTATGTCTVNLSDLMLPGGPGTKTPTSTATSVVGQYRQRAPDDASDGHIAKRWWSANHTRGPLVRGPHKGGQAGPLWQPRRSVRRAYDGATAVMTEPGDPPYRPAQPAALRATDA